MQEAKQLHAHIIATGLQQQELYLRKLINFFAISNPSSLYYARMIFDQIENPSTFIYNSMIRAYSASPNPQQALILYNQMFKNGPSPDKYTFPFLLKACSSLLDLRKGEETHCQSIKHGFSSNIFVQNSLIHLYGSNAKINMAHKVFDEMCDRDVATWTTLVTCNASHGSIEIARRVFDEMPEKSVVSFSAMITGYVRKGRFKEALELFRDLQIEGLEPNDSTIMGVISACASLGTLDTGRWIHSYIRHRKGNRFDSRINTALIDMYFKCGSIKDATNVFVGAKEKHVGEWTAMISGMAIHGFGERSMELFEDMVRSGVKPNVVTFVGLLSGCTHAGLVKEGLMYFERMKSEFGIEPTVEHCGCVVDFLGRGGLIDQAVEFMKEMTMEANAAMWGALLNACKVHKNIKVAELAAKWLVREEPWNGAIYMSLLSLYGEVGRWDDVEKVKREMKEVGCRKSPGCSLIEVNGVCYEFVVGDKSYPPALQVCLKMEELIREVKEKNLYFA
ncbi:Pentatricopeptide repeat [Macleaya cordata]|uniref:Pentatricopeptide repeat n=1 Tax=Macleaya cordata TaxID=56857 RepID=A0A200QT21_MACCD|nr:Pentatricopeptide repeat [Macleaya cordata]